MLNLNEPNALGDVSWVKPAKFVGVWWEMHLDRSTWATGPRHGATTANTRRYIDFAAQNGFRGVLVEGWNRGWDGDWADYRTERRFDLVIEKRTVTAGDTLELRLAPGGGQAIRLSPQS